MNPVLCLAGLEGLHWITWGVLSKYLGRNRKIMKGVSPRAEIDAIIEKEGKGNQEMSDFLVRVKSCLQNSREAMLHWGLCTIVCMTVGVDKTVMEYASLFMFLCRCGYVYSYLNASKRGLLVGLRIFCYHVPTTFLPFYLYYLGALKYTMATGLMKDLPMNYLYAAPFPVALAFMIANSFM
mmetsp:Transcript_19752/g.21971  ORF Transcript_19752/g.21971 Transcript_19752/m.21971 type:complete len:181 (+) Transcript_19752:33-575(+)